MDPRKADSVRQRGRVRYAPIVLKKSAAGASRWLAVGKSPKSGRPPHAGIGAGIGISLASFRRFWAAGGEVELVSCSVGSAQAQAVELQDALEVSEQHLDLLALAA